MDRYEITCKGSTPLMVDRMDQADLERILIPDSTKRGKVKNPDITPRDIAAQKTYMVKDKFVIPTQYLLGAVKNVASEYKQKNSTRKSVKSIIAGVFQPEEEFAQLLDHKEKPVKGFEVDMRRAVGSRGAVCACRPRFDQWQFKTTFTLDSELVHPDTMLSILNDAGKRSGIGSYRVSKGGIYGQFQVIKFVKLKD